ncbi:MAG: TetR/AcrR family transcriptional regulator [Candidatus Cloacimonetes bacterium]|nr:TetR/AcrR family transcriptional regulator [Candidatus Cloacimonadota bacterium]
MFTERQEQIVKTAIKLIANKGIQNLTTKNLAKEIGISEPALYRHFDNKLEILKGVIHYFQITMKPAFDKMRESDQPIKQVRLLFVTHLQIFSNNSDFAKIFFSESNFQNEEVLMTSMNKIMSSSRKELEKIIIAGQKNNEIRSDISSISILRMIIGSMRFLVTQWSISGMIFDLENEGNQLWNDFQKIIVAK